MKKPVLLSQLFFILFAVFSLSAINIETDYDRKIESIFPEEDSVKITLSNGLIFEWSPKNYEREMLTEWQEGDEISIDVESGYPNLYLKNEDIDLLYYPRVVLNEESVQILPTIERMIRFPYQSWEDYFNLFVSLSDGSCWKITLINKNDQMFTHWQVGDRMIVGDGFKYHWMINFSLVERGFFEFSQELAEAQ